MVNFKKRIEETKEIDAKNEVEFEIEKVEDFLKLLDEFGFKKWVKKEKNPKMNFILMRKN